jgi:tetratricopeptide (TPR) repeat protein
VAVWKALNNQAIKLYQEGRYSEAAKVAEKSLKVAEYIFVSNHLNIAKSLKNLAALYYSQDKYSEAGPFSNEHWQ